MRAPIAARIRAMARRFSTYAGSAALADVDTRRRKARKVIEVLRERPPATTLARVLDIGCSHGVMLDALGEEFGPRVGCDMDVHADFGPLHRPGTLDFVNCDGEHLPFADASFSVVLCSHTYEHTPAPERLLAEIHRVLAPGGVCYFSGPNRLAPVEPHYGLPLLSWLPHPLCDWYMRLAGADSGYYINPRTLAGMRRLFTGFEVDHCTPRMLAEPVRYGIEDLLPPGSWKLATARLVLRWLPVVFPDFVFLLRRPAPLSDRGA